MPEFDPEAFASALKSFAEGADSPYMNLAQGLAHVKAAELEPLSFGVINSVVIGGTYREGQEYVAENLQTGVDNMHTVLQGLVQVAANYQNVEQANLVQPGDVSPSEVSLDQNHRADEALQGFSLYLAAKIGFLAVGSAGLAKASTSFAISAGVGAALWLLYLPNDGALDVAHGHWVEASKGLDAFRESANSGARSISETWSGESQETFLDYMEAFVNEVNTCKEAADTAADSLESVHNSLTQEQWVWFVTSLANLIALIVMEVAGSAFPPAKPAWKAAQEVLGVIFSVSVSSWIAIAATAVKAVVMNINSVSNASFVTEKSDESERVDFESVALSGEDLGTLTEDIDA